MKEGDIIICDNKSVNGNYTTDGLTIGKKYKIYTIRTFSNSIIIKQAYYLIRDDSNKLGYYNIDCFISIQKHRDKLINSIINDI